MVNEPTRADGAEDRHPLNDPHGDATTPLDLKVRIATQRLLVEWRDGHRSDYSLDELRGKCPCASCRTEREKRAKNPLHVLKSSPSGSRVTRAELVGTYAIKFVWSDGHDTGLFDFRFLRSLDQEVPSGAGD